MPLNNTPMLTRISVFLITLSGLILEVGLTRIYSASIWYHFAFVAISVALLGWGLGGFAVQLLKRSLRLSMSTAALVTLLYAGAIPLCLWILVTFPFELQRLPLYFLAPLLPFFLAGMALSMVFDIHRAEAGSLYFADLVGAAGRSFSHGLALRVWWRGRVINRSNCSCCRGIAAFAYKRKRRNTGQWK